MNQLTTYDPFADTGIDELFRGFFRPVRFEKSGPAMIKMDVTEQDNAYLVKAEIPGVAKEDIQVAIEGNQALRVADEICGDVDAFNGGRRVVLKRFVHKTSLPAIHDIFCQVSQLDAARFVVEGIGEPHSSIRARNDAIGTGLGRQPLTVFGNVSGH